MKDNSDNVQGKTMKNNYIYVAACVLTREHPELSKKLQTYVQERFSAEIIRCCVEKYDVARFEESMQDGIKDEWKRIPQYMPFGENDIMVYACHNCSAIFQETQPLVPIFSLWELILSDETFPYKDFQGKSIAIQDCWRSYDNRNEQEAVRKILQKMNINVIELDENFENTKFCGISTLQPTPKRNLIKAPIRYVQNAKGMFEPHSEEEKLKAMQEHAQKIDCDTIISYCHYCHKGLQMTGKTALLLGDLLF